MNPSPTYSNTWEVIPPSVRWWTSYIQACWRFLGLLDLASHHWSFGIRQSNAIPMMARPLKLEQSLRQCLMCSYPNPSSRRVMWVDAFPHSHFAHWQLHGQCVSQDCVASTNYLGRELEHRLVSISTTAHKIVTVGQKCLSQRCTQRHKWCTRIAHSNYALTHRLRHLKPKDTRLPKAFAEPSSDQPNLVSSEKTKTLVGCERLNSFMILAFKVVHQIDLSRYLSQCQSKPSSTDLTA